MFDIIIVGAGSAGSVIAARASEDPGRSVLLIEAGPDYPDVAQTPFDLVNSHNNSYNDHDWGFSYEPTRGREVVFPRGRVTGGSSAVNTTIALRGMPEDYDEAGLHHPLTRKLMQRIEFRHGGAEYDGKYPDGIPTTLEIDHRELGSLSSGLVMYPEGHARNDSGNLAELLRVKFDRLASLAVDDSDALYKRFGNLTRQTAEKVAGLYDFEIRPNI